MIGVVRERKLEELDLGPSAGHRGLLGKVAYFAFFAAIAWGFVFLFFQLTRSWQVALGCVTLLVGYMLLSGWLAERSASGADNTMD